MLQHREVRGVGGLGFVHGAGRKTRAKIKMAADSYPVRFIAIKAKTKKDGGGWALEEF